MPDRGTTRSIVRSRDARRRLTTPRPSHTRRTRPSSRMRRTWSWEAPVGHPPCGTPPRHHIPGATRHERLLEDSMKTALRSLSCETWRYALSSHVGRAELCN
jgi:hypothetical protein